MRDAQEAKSWFLAQVRPNCIQIAERNLRRQAFDTFVPWTEETRRQRGRFCQRRVPLFPGYLFVGFDPERGGWRAINSTHGVSRLVAFAGMPQAVPDSLLVALRDRCDPSGLLLPPETLKPGDEVEVTRGPFADFIVTVEQVTPDRRVWILIDLMGRAARVSVAPEDVRPVRVTAD